MIKKNLKFVLFILVVLFFLNILAWIAVFDLSKPQFLEVHFFNVGQGDAIFIETPSRHQILIDGGPSSTILEKLGKEMPFYDKSIDLMVLTHPEHDHISGLLEVLKKYKVDNILWTGVLRDTAEFRKWGKLIKEEKANIKIAEAGQKIIFSTRLGLVDKYIEILYPFENLEGKTVKNTNNTSIIARLVFNKNSFLFTGDAYESGEKKLLGKERDINSNVLKVGHHGSKTSSSEEFLKKVLPEIAVISVGGDENVKGLDCDNKKRNKYGHPSCRVLERLGKFDIKVLRTDKLGDIKIISDGKNINYEVSNL
jgi:competence protein ComEC